MASLSDTYQKKTDIEHILDAPDTYVGAIDDEQTRAYCIEEKA